jgi:hypothetical protein
MIAGPANISSLLGKAIHRIGQIFFLLSMTSITHGRASEKIKRRILRQRCKKNILLQGQVNSIYPAIRFSMLSSMFF